MELVHRNTKKVVSTVIDNMELAGVLRRSRYNSDDEKRFELNFGGKAFY